jgi:hypothetical protein
LRWESLARGRRTESSPFGSGRLTGKPHLTPAVWAAAAVPASVLTAARKLKYSWIPGRLTGSIRPQQSGSEFLPHSDDSDVIVLAPGTRGFYDLICAACADFARAIKAKELAPRVHRFDDAIRDESHHGFRRDANSCFAVLNLAHDSEREVCVEIDFRAVEIRRKMACIGEGGNTIGLEAGADTGDKAAIYLTGDGAIQSIEHGGGTALYRVAENADQQGDKHCGFQPFARDVTENDNATI